MANPNKQIRQEILKKEQQRQRQLYQQQQTARLGQKLPEQALNKSVSDAGERGKEGEGKPTNESDVAKPNEREQQRHLETAKHLAKAAAHATAGSKTAAIKEGLKAVKSAGGAKALAGMIGQAGTAKILAWAWRIAFTGVGIIFTFFYVNFHGMMCYIASSPVFCHFGSEWTPGGKLGKFSQKSKAANFFLEIAELTVVIFVDLIVFIALLIIIALVYYMISPDIALKDLGLKLL
ncbi:MAG: hypothetical protein KAS12_00195 [Candidatus Aenigmarchaeota archaeon]|nr:hypothetical protein [Candidatus Aenigmarchaeota archaeon]